MKKNILIHLIAGIVFTLILYFIAGLQIEASVFIGLGTAVLSWLTLGRTLNNKHH